MTSDSITTKDEQHAGISIDHVEKNDRDTESISNYDDLDVKKQSDTSTEPDGDKVALALAEKKLVRKLDSRILPIVCLMYLFACTYFFSVFASCEYI